ncbi:addiction module protein [Candidatus Williamhamiltonella defendens]|uniref:Addiction module toxin n=1 Tax=Hamiltonella defensa subsp. Acyrthosiphon pisum (strain 5AT) TaxID=572265 RepID=C4K569_HAMD5|nr:type II toxin-antitoxin system RelE/ParE family toxin [Candidatus Hamiltonella defensa]ACQ67712.1 addiction module toxin [Candidatus Hamiltonella defensa 5AT (Acyrthosiphon pisum)]ATW22407.1 addiction module protein [Candidatus Hamiltonella defensa]
MYQIRHYLDKSERDHFSEWRDQISDTKAKIAIDRRIMRIELGNFGDHKPVREGVWELRIDVGPGYRVYYAKVNITVVLLLCGGDKRKQNADIDRACAYWHDWQKRTGD